MISILMSCYKSNFDYLGEQIDSIIHQTERDWELLIYNDGTEGLEDWLLKNYPEENITYYDEGHLGYAKAYNYLLYFAEGEYICFCDQDDIWELDKLEVEKKYLDENKDVDAVFGWLEWFGEKNKIETFSISDADISKELLFWQPIKQPTVMFRKDRFGEFDSPYDIAGDYWFWSKHFDRHYHLIEKVLAKYRRHSGELTKDTTGFRETTAKIIQRNMEMFGRSYQLEICKSLDRYSKTYNKDLKETIQHDIWRFYESGIIKKT